jgi:hypothetical protein
MLWLDLLVMIVEIDEVPGEHIGRADRKTHGALVDQVEIDELLERLAQRRAVELVAVLVPAGLNQGLGARGEKKLG